jgi:hypothetical protein
MTPNNTMDDKKKTELISKLKQGTITSQEAQQLKAVLEKEKEEATRQGNTALVIGIAILLGFVIKYISEDKTVDKILKFLFGK